VQIGHTTIENLKGGKTP